jgi:glycosyltransferase involved in cell wall biosynthesis
VHSIHGFGFHAGQPWPVRRAYISAERAAARATTQFIAVSRAGAAEGIALGLFGPERCRVIRSGVETARFAAAARQRGGFRAELGLGPADPLVGMIACLKPQKCPEDFVEVAGRVLADEPRATFVLAGDGELRGAVEARIAAIPGGRQRILLLGWRRDTERILADLDVALLTSRWEGLPRVLPEAMAAGRPVVATAVDGSPEAVEEGVSGFLAPAGGTELLAHRVLELLRDPGLRLRMGAEGARRAGEWDIDAMVRSQEALYDELLSGGPSAA